MYKNIKEKKQLTKELYTSKELIKFSRFIDGVKVVVEAKNIEEAELLFAKKAKESDNE